MIDTFPTPGNWHDPSLPAAQTQAVCDAGKARTLALEIVRLCLVAFWPGDDREAAARAGMSWLFGAVHALAAWHARALDIESGRENDRPRAERLTMHDVAGAADRIASIAWHRHSRVTPIPPEDWIVHDLAVALRRACECSDRKPLRRTDVEDVENLNEKARKNPAIGEYYELANAYHRENEEHRVHHDHTARTLLPLLIRDVRDMLRAAKVDGSAIEAAIVAHGGTPS